LTKKPGIKTISEFLVKKQRIKKYDLRLIDF
jgi:hypothetical protein